MSPRSLYLSRLICFFTIQFVSVPPWAFPFLRLILILADRIEDVVCEPREKISVKPEINHMKTFWYNCFYLVSYGIFLLSCLLHHFMVSVISTSQIHSVTGFITRKMWDNKNSTLTNPVEESSHPHGFRASLFYLMGAVKNHSLA